MCARARWREQGERGREGEREGDFGSFEHNTRCPSLTHQVFPLAFSPALLRFPPLLGLPSPAWAPTGHRAKGAAQFAQLSGVPILEADGRGGNLLARHPPGQNVSAAQGALHSASIICCVLLCYHTCPDLPRASLTPSVAPRACASTCLASTCTRVLLSCSLLRALSMCLCYEY